MQKYEKKEVAQHFCWQPQFSIFGNCIKKRVFEGEYKVAFKRGQRVLAHFAEWSNQKELNAENTFLGNFLLQIN